MKRVVNGKSIPMKITWNTFFDAFQRTREEIELQMADENLKLKAMSLQLRDFDNENNMKQDSLEKRFKSSIDELANQKRRLMDQVKQVKHSFHFKNIKLMFFISKRTAYLNICELNGNDFLL